MDLSQRERKPLSSFQRSLDLAFGVAVGDRGSFVIEFLAAREADLELSQSAFQVHSQWHDGQTTFLDFTAQAVDLVAM